VSCLSNSPDFLLGLGQRPPAKRSIFGLLNRCCPELASRVAFATASSPVADRSGFGGRQDPPPLGGAGGVTQALWNPADRRGAIQLRLSEAFATTNGLRLIV